MCVCVSVLLNSLAYVSSQLVAFLFARNYLYFLQVITRNSVRASSFWYFKGLSVCKSHLQRNWILQRVHRKKVWLVVGFFKDFFHLLTIRKFSVRINTQLLIERVLFTVLSFCPVIGKQRKAEGWQHGKWKMKPWKMTSKRRKAGKRKEGAKGCHGESAPGMPEIYISVGHCLVLL